MIVRSVAFRQQLALMDEYARVHGLGVWATRIVVVAMKFGHPAARQFAEDPGICAWAGCPEEPRGRSKYCSRECSNKNARWRHRVRGEGREPINDPLQCYERLIEVGLFSEDPWGVVWDSGAEPWESDPIRWLHTVIQIAEGCEPPAGFPLLSRARTPHLRLVG